MSKEVRGVWGPLQDVGPSVPDGFSSEIAGVACPAPGSCVAVGNYIAPMSATGMEHSSTFMIAQDRSGWSSPQQIPFPGTGPHPRYGVASLQCPAKNYCVIVGLDDVTQVVQKKYSQTWENGKWGAPHFFSQSTLGGGFATLWFNALSCPSTSWCMGVGQYQTATGRSAPFSVTMSTGRWGPLKLLTGYHGSTNDNALTSVSCVASGVCVATGASRFGRGDEASVPLIMSESGGHWAPPRTLPIPGVTSSQLDPTQVPVVSCATDSQCTGTIASFAADGLTIGVATLRGSGQWTVVRISNLGRFESPTLLALSCFKAGCVGLATATGPPSGPARVQLVVTTSGAW
jgi:hypothetical protein